MTDAERWRALTEPQKKLLQGLYVTRKHYFADYYPPVKKLLSLGLIARAKEYSNGQYSITEQGDTVYKAGLGEGDKA